MLLCYHDDMNLTIDDDNNNGVDKTVIVEYIDNSNDDSVAVAVVVDDNKIDYWFVSERDSIRSYSNT